MDIVTLPDDLADTAVELWHECGLTRPWNDPHADVRRALGSASSTVLAALDGRVLVGTAMVGYDGHRGWVHYVAVSSAARRGGVGRDLMAGAEQWAAARGAPKLQLNVRDDNLAVVAFYESLGYEEQRAITLGKRL